MKFLIFSLSIFIMTSCYGNEENRVVGLHSSVNEAYNASLIAPSLSKSKGVFRDSFVGLDILKVVADGVEITPENIEVNLSDLDTLVINLEKEFYQYQVDIRYLRCAHSISQEKGVVASMYEVPDSFGELTIKYRVRYPGGELGEVWTYSSYELSENERYMKEFKGSFWELLGGGF